MRMSNPLKTRRMCDPNVGPYILSTSTFLKRAFAPGAFSNKLCNEGFIEYLKQFTTIIYSKRLE